MLKMPYMNTSTIASTSLRLYKKEPRVVVIVISAILAGILFLWLFPSHNRLRDIIGIICFGIGFVVGVPPLITWTIAIDNEAVYILYSLFGKVFHIRKKILFKDIRWFTVNDVGWFVVLPFKDSYKYRLRETIIIQKDIRNREDLVKSILGKVDPSVVDERVKLCLAGKYKEAGISGFRHIFLGNK